MIKKLIIKSNEWYDNLPEPKRSLFFLIVVFGGLIISQYFMFVENSVIAFIIWSSLISWRCGYIFIDWIDQYKKIK